MMICKYYVKYIGFFLISGVLLDLYIIEDSIHNTLKNNSNNAKKEHNIFKPKI